MTRSVAIPFKDHAWIVVAYAAAIAAAVATVSVVADEPVWARVLAADVVATVVVFAFSVAFRNSSFYDPYWSVAPVVIVAYFWTLADDVSTRGVVATVIVCAWAIRLTGNWAYGWRGLGHEDWRYVDLAASTGRFWWPVSFLGVHLFPTLIVFVACLSLEPAVTVTARPLGTWDGVAVAIGAFSIWIEFEADRQLHRFRELRQSAAEVLTTGVWRWCRHPNYLGEIGFWFSVWFFGYAALGSTDRWLQAGPIAMVLLFVVVSIPMIERKLLGSKPGYDAYRRRTYALLPISHWRNAPS